jgi:hypothetical protein
MAVHSLTNRALTSTRQVQTQAGQEPDAEGLIIEEKKRQLQMKKKALFWVAITIGLVNAVFGIGSVILARLNGVSWVAILSDGGWILDLSITSIGILIAVSRPRNPLGWIFFAIGFSQGLVSFAFQYATFSMVTSPDALPGGPLMSVLGQIAWLPGLSLMLTYAILLFPTGHLPSRRWRVLGWLSGLPLVFFIPFAIYTWPYRGLVLLLHPEQIQPAAGIYAVLSQVSFPILLLCGLACVVSLIVRFRKADLTERQQIKWVIFSACIFFVAIVLTDLNPTGAFLREHGLTFLLMVPVSIALPAAVGMAILRYRLWEIDILINRTLVYVPLTGILSGVYAASISLLQKAFIAITGAKSDGAIVLTTLILASTFTPIKNALQALVDRRFKNPAEPLAALKTYRRQIQTVAEVVDKKSALKHFLDESVSALQASSGAIFLSHAGAPQVVSVTGDWVAGLEALSIPIGKETGDVGTLYLGLRRDGTPYTESEISSLTGVADILGLVLE